MIGFIKAYRYALENLKKLNISEATRNFLFHDYNNRLKAEFESLQINVPQEEQSEKFKTLYKKLDSYLKSIKSQNSEISNKEDRCDL